MSDQTRTRILKGAVSALSVQGAGRVGTDVIARRAGVPAARVGEYFTGVEEVVVAAVEYAVTERVRACAPELEGARTVGEVVRVGRQACVAGEVVALVWSASRNRGPVVGEQVAAVAVRVWSGALEQALVRVLAGSPAQEFVEPAGLARMMAASLVGAGLSEEQDPAGAERALDSLEQVGELVSALGVLGPQAQRAVRIRLRHAGTARGLNLA